MSLYNHFGKNYKLPVHLLIYRDLSLTSFCLDRCKFDNVSSYRLGWLIWLEFTFCFVVFLCTYLSIDCQIVVNSRHDNIKKTQNVYKRRFSQHILDLSRRQMMISICVMHKYYRNVPNLWIFRQTHKRTFGPNERNRELILLNPIKRSFEKENTIDWTIIGFQKKPRLESIAKNNHNYVAHLIISVN